MTQATSQFAAEPTAAEFAAGAQRRDLLFVGLGLAVALAAGAAASISPIIPVVAVLGSAALFLTVRAPKFGVFVLFLAAITIEGDTNSFADKTTEVIRFFRPLQEMVPGSGVILSMAELYMLLIGVVCLVRAIYLRRRPAPRGALLFPLLILFGWWMFEVGNGIATGGNAKLAFQEVRTPTYALVLYLCAYGLITEAKDLDRLGWIVILGGGLKGFQGCFRYFVTLHGDVSAFWGSGRSILEHHEAFLFNGYFFYTLLLFVTGGPKAQKRAALCLLPLVAFANLMNHRRAADAATFTGLLVFIPLFCTFYPRYRSLTLRIVVAASVLFTVYAAAFWHSESKIALPLQSLRSQIAPTKRDASSDEYRKIENANLKYTIQQSQILGYGFGKEFLRPIPMLDLRKVDPYLFVMPHNSILWVWMRLGAAGFMFFWLLNAQWIRHAFYTAANHSTPVVRRWALFALLIVLIHIAIALWDMGLYGMRVQVYLGVILGVMDRLALIARAEGESESCSTASSTSSSEPERRPRTRSSTLTEGLNAWSSGGNGCLAHSRKRSCSFTGSRRRTPSSPATGT
jgi:hypothetical protein